MSEPQTPQPPDGDLERAVEAIQEGDSATGRRLLAQVLRADPHSVQAWLWMSDAVDTAQQRQECLQRVLSLDPSNEIARARLAAQRRIDKPGDEAAGASARPIPGSARGPRIGTAARRGTRYVMLAGAMTLTLIGGLILLTLTATTIAPQTRERMRPTREPVLYVATLWCQPCEQAGHPIALWDQVSEGGSRGVKTGELVHNTEVAVLDEGWSETEGRAYLKVQANGQTGWVSEAFIRR